MIRPFLKNEEGSAALEFAIIAPLSLSLLFGAVTLGVAAWNKNIVQGVAYETARCVALQASACSAVPAGCDSNVPGVCFATSRATDRGLTNLRTSDVTLNAAATINTVTFTTVGITYQFNMVGYHLALTGYAAFPNGG